MSARLIVAGYGIVLSGLTVAIAVPIPGPSDPGALAVAQLTLLGPALARYGRVGVAARDRARWTDLLGFSAAIAVSMWALSAGGRHRPATDLACAAVVALVLQLLTVRRLNPTLIALAATGAGWLVIALIPAPPVLGRAGPAELATLAFGAAVAAALLARSPHGDGPLAEAVYTRRRLGLATAVCLAAPLVLGLRWTALPAPGLAVLLGLAAILAGASRLADAVAGRRRWLARARSTEPLGDLADLEHFTRRLGHATAQARRGGPPVATVAVTLPPSAGSGALAQTARHLLLSLPGPDDVAARLGPAEFAVLLLGVDPAVVDGYARALQATLSTAAIATQVDTATGLSAELAGSGVTRPDLGGRRSGRVRVAGGMAMRAALDRAVAGDALGRCYQPVVDLGGGTVVGWDTLVRWPPPGPGVVPAAQVLALAEDAGLAGPIGDWLLPGAIADAAQWPKPLGTAGYVSVAVGSRQLRSDGFADHVLHILASAGLPAGRLILQLPEDAVPRADDPAWTRLVRLRTAGVRLAVDHFGTGLAAPNYLLHTPVDLVTIDQSFVEKIAASPRHRSLVTSIIAMATALDVTVIAEGVCTHAEADLLRRHGCALGQGPLFGAAVSAARR